MNPFNLFKRKVKDETINSFVGATSFSQLNPGYYNHYTSEKYASAYPNIRAIANEYMTVMPKAIDANGKQVQNNPILNALYHPNQSDSVVSFNEKIAVSTLSLRKTYILVWRNEGGVAMPGGNFGVKGRNIAGFTFLENPSITRRDGKTFYNIGSQEFNENEVAVLSGGVEPHNLYAGYSPTEAVVRWITLDDYIADFQKGFFENNAIPAGMFKIVASTVKEYNDIVDMLKHRHKGAGANNNVTYTHQPTDKTTGKPVQAQIEWLPFQQSNRDIDFASIFNQANKRIDVAYGVPAIIKGIDDTATYANAQVSERSFAKRAVLPLLTRNYSQLTHELNRITGGIGIALTFDYEIPEVADSLRVEAETNNLQANLIKLLTDDGYTLDSIVDAFDLPKRLKLLTIGEAPAVIENDKPEVDEGEEVENAPDREKIDGITPLNEVAVSENPKACSCGCDNEHHDHNPKAQLTENDSKMYEDKLKIVIRDAMSRQIERSVEALDSPSESTEKEDEKQFVDEMMVIIASIMAISGGLQYEQGLALLVAEGISLDGTSRFTLSESQEKAYRKYLKKVGKSYGNDTQKAIQAVLDRANVDGLNVSETKGKLRSIMQTDEWRVKRLANSELNYSQQIGNNYSMEQIQSEVGVQIKKVWNTSSDSACEYCQSLNGKTVGLQEVFVGKNDIILGTEGGMFVNDFANIEGAHAHPNCQCYTTYEVVR